MLKPLPWYVRMPLVIALVVGAFFAGKFTAPIEVQEVRSVEVRWKEKTSKTARAATAKTKIVYVDRIVLPNGTVKEKSETRETEATLIDATSLTERSGLARETAKTITISKPGWRVGVLVGASATPPVLPLSGPLVLGVQAEVRLVGGLWLGAWGLTSGAAGGSLSLEIPK